MRATPTGIALVSCLVAAGCVTPARARIDLLPDGSIGPQAPAVAWGTMEQADEQLMGLEPRATASELAVASWSGETACFDVLIRTTGGAIPTWDARVQTADGTAPVQTLTLASCRESPCLPRGSTLAPLRGEPRVQESGGRFCVSALPPREGPIRVEVSQGAYVLEFNLAVVRVQPPSL